MLVANKHVDIVQNMLRMCRCILKCCIALSLTDVRCQSWNRADAPGVWATPSESLPAQLQHSDCLYPRVIILIIIPVRTLSLPMLASAASEAR